MLHSLTSFPRRHWRGKIGFLPSVLLTLLGLRGLILFLGGIPFVTLDVLVLIWQVTGTWRAMARAQADRADLMAQVFGIAAMVICLPIMALSHLDRVSRDILGRRPEATTAPTGLRLIPTEAILEGAISFTMATALENALTEHPQITTLALSSQGGRVFAARAIALLVEKYQLDTHVEATCASACTLIFIAGRNRSLGPDARLGFHGYQLHAYLESVDPGEEEEKDRAAFRARGVSEGFLAQIFSASPDDMWFPERGELFQAGVITMP